jgi:hypothetical protein
MQYAPVETSQRLIVMRDITKAAPAASAARPRRAMMRQHPFPEVYL